MKGNGRMDAENIRAYVMKVIMERLHPSAEKAQKDGTNPAQLADFRLRHGVQHHIAWTRCVQQTGSPVDCYPDLVEARLILPYTVFCMNMNAMLGL